MGSPLIQVVTDSGRKSSFRWVNIVWRGPHSGQTFSGAGEETPKHDGGREGHEENRKKPKEKGDVGHDLVILELVVNRIRLGAHPGVRAAGESDEVTSAANRRRPYSCCSLQTAQRRQGKGYCLFTCASLSAVPRDSATMALQGGWMRTCVKCSLGQLVSTTSISTEIRAVT
jgi:hypothetical protein